MEGSTVYGILNSKIKGLASGFDHATKTGDNTFDIYFKDGSHVSLTIPQPELDEEAIKEQIEGLTDETVADWLEENKDNIKGEDGNTVQVLESADEPINDKAVLIFDPNEVITQDNYNKAQADVRFAKAVEVGDVSKLTVSSWKDLVSAINDTFGRGMGAYKFEVDESKKQLTIVCRNGVEVPIDISQIILNTNITEFKDMLVTSILDGQSLVWNASKKKWVNKSIDSSGVLVEAKQYTDDEIKKFNNKGSLAVDEKPTYYGGIITYKQGGTTKTTENAGTWFYYFDENSKAVQTIFIEGTEFTIAMAGDINLDDYIAQTEKIDVFDDSFTDKTKVPTTRYIEELKGIIDDGLGEKINTTDIEDSLASDATDKPLSAKQGKELNSTKLNKTTDVENSGKALVVDESGNIVFGDAGVKVSSEEGNKITEKDDGIFVASEIDDENISEDSTWSSEKISDSLVDLAYFNLVGKDIYSGDLNSIKDGVYRVGGNATNTPTGTAGYLTCIVRDEGKYISQTYHAENNTMYQRTCVNGTWSAWKELATMDKVVKATVKEYTLDANGAFAFGISASNFVNAICNMTSDDREFYLTTWTWKGLVFGKVTSNGTLTTGQKISVSVYTIGI